LHNRTIAIAPRKHTKSTRVSRSFNSANSISRCSLSLPSRRYTDARLRARPRPDSSDIGKWQSRGHLYFVCTVGSAHKTRFRKVPRCKSSISYAGPKVRKGSKIGIGGPLTVPPLPHHRAYGSRTTAVRPGYAEAET